MKYLMKSIGYVIVAVAFSTCSDDAAESPVVEGDETDQGQETDIQALVEDELFIDFIDLAITESPAAVDVAKYKELSDRFETLTEEELEALYTAMGYDGLEGVKVEIKSLTGLLERIDEKYGLLSLEKPRRDSIFRLGIDIALANQRGRTEEVACFALARQLSGSEDRCGDCYEEYNSELNRYISGYINEQVRCTALVDGDVDSEAYTDCMAVTGYQLRKNDSEFVLACCIADDCLIDPETEDDRCLDQLGSQEKCCSD